MFHLFLPPLTVADALGHIEQRFYLTAASAPDGVTWNEFWNTRDNSQITEADITAFKLCRSAYNIQVRGPQIYLEDPVCAQITFR